MEDNKTVEVQSKQIEGVLVINLSGAIHGLEVQKFHEELLEATGGFDKPVLLDFEKVLYINSAGLRSILMVAKKLQKRKSKFAVCSLPRRIKALFNMSAFDRVIDVFESRSEAIKAITK